MDENTDPRMHSQHQAGMGHNGRVGRPLEMTLKRITDTTPADGPGNEAVLEPEQGEFADPVTTSDRDSLPPSVSSISLTESLGPASAQKDFSETTLNIHAQDFPKLKLSGRIISVTLCLPHTVLFTHGEDQPWTIRHRAGTSALFDSFAFLSSKQSTWKHTLIGWTGEIDQRRSPKIATKLERVLDAHPPSSRHSAPVPVDNEPLPVPMDPTLRLSRANRLELEQILLGSRGIRMVPVWLQDNPYNDGDMACFTSQTKWRHFSERQLYQVMHYRFPSIQQGKIRNVMWAQFHQMNQAFTDRILEHYRPGDIVMVHDYQLMLVPSMLRARVGDVKICYLLHTPFPSYEYFRVLSHAQLLMQGLLGADLIAFQSTTFIDHFQMACRKLIKGSQASIYAVDLPGDKSRNVSLQVLPIGINNEDMERSLFRSKDVQHQIRRLEEQWGGYKLIVGRDRMDGARGVVQKLEAFAMFLDLNPQWRGKVILVQIKKVHSLVAAINGKFGDFDWTPVRYYTRYIARSEYLALLRQASLGLITSVRDGMNTTSLEYAFAQKYTHAPLLLSEFSGTSTHLTGAVRINPFDTANTANIIAESLKRSGTERDEMYAAITPPLEAWSIQRWVERALRKLCVHLDICETTVQRPLLNNSIHDRFGRSTTRLLIFDYDGTLTPIVDSPHAAIPSADLINCLDKLASDEQNSVWIVSGRDRQFLSDHLGSIRNLGFSAEHGSFIKIPGKDDWTELASNENIGWRPIVQEEMEATTKKVPGSVVEVKSIGITWHYRQSDERLGAIQARLLHKKLVETVGTQFEVEIMPGKANLEIRPRKVNKGQVVRRLLETYGRTKTGEAEFVLCVGDDRTDEDMFRALRRSDVPMSNLFSIIVSDQEKPTLASWRVPEVSDVMTLLKSLATIDAPHMRAESFRRANVTEHAGRMENL